MSTVLPPPMTGSRSRPQARKKASDDAAYFGPPVGGSGASGTKRQAVDKAEGEPRVKRKRVEANATTAAANSSNNSKRDDIEQKTSLVEFVKLPTHVLCRYLTQFDIIPSVYPSPLSADDPAPPSSLGNTFRQLSRAPSPPPLTPANRPRRESKEQSRRRSSRLLEEETRSRTPILADIEELHVVLAGIVEKHFQMSSISGREEVDTLASFMCAVEKVKGGKNKC